MVAVHKTQGNAVVGASQTAAGHVAQRGRLPRVPAQGAEGRLDTSPASHQPCRCMGPRKSCRAVEKTSWIKVSGLPSCQNRYCLPQKGPADWNCLREKVSGPSGGGGRRRRRMSLTGDYY